VPPRCTFPILSSLNPQYPHHLHHVPTLAHCHVAPVVVVLPFPLDLLMCRLHLVTHRRLLSTSPPGCISFAGLLSCCISSRCHLASPFVAPPPHVSILYPPPSFALASCCVTSCRAASASRPLVNTATFRRATTSPLPFASPSPRLVAVLPHVASLPHIC
jgi:hypothetical protein